MKKTLAMLVTIAVATVASANTYDDVILYRGAGDWFLSHNPGFYPAGTAPVTSFVGGFGLAAATPLVGDINGDGIDDVVVAQDAGGGAQQFFANHSVLSAIPGQGSLGGGGVTVSGLFGTVGGSQGVFLADVNGDGIDDAVNVEGTGFAWQANHSTAAGLNGATTSTIATWGGTAFGDTALMGDFDGDGTADAALYRPNGGGGDWFVNKSSAAGLGTGGTAITSFGLATDIPLIGDFNGDGRDDGLLVRDNGVGGFLWFAGFSDVNGIVAGDGFNSNAGFGLSAIDTPFVADVNGDGLDDIGISRDNGLGAMSYFVSFTGAGGVLGTTVDAQWEFGLAAGDTALFGDFNVIPEPAALGMLLLGGGILWVRKRLMI